MLYWFFLFSRFIKTSGLLLLLLFPLVNFKFGLSSAIFPAFDIIFLYYFSTYYNIKFWQLFIFGIFCDELYSMPFGANSLFFIFADIILAITSKWCLLKRYISNFIIFCGYCLLILCLRYGIYDLYLKQTVNIFEMTFQLLTTIFSYPLIRIFLDKFIISKND